MNDTGSNSPPSYPHHYTDFCNYNSINLTAGDVITVSSSNYPEKYNVNTECTVYLSAHNNGRVVLRFLDFELEEGWDFLTVGTGRNSSNVISKYTGHYVPETLSSEITDIWIFFDADGLYSFKGFLLQFEWQNQSGELV